MVRYGRTDTVTAAARAVQATRPCRPRGPRPLWRSDIDNYAGQGDRGGRSGCSHGGNHHGGSYDHKERYRSRSRSSSLPPTDDPTASSQNYLRSRSHFFTLKPPNPGQSQPLSLSLFLRLQGLGQLR